MRDQMIGLSYALVISGILVGVVEGLILSPEVFARILPLAIACFLLGAAGIYFFRFRQAAVPPPPPPADE